MSCATAEQSSCTPVHTAGDRTGSLCRATCTCSLELHLLLPACLPTLQLFGATPESLPPDLQAQLQMAMALTPTVLQVCMPACRPALS